MEIKKTYSEKIAAIEQNMDNLITEEETLVAKVSELQHKIRRILKTISYLLGRFYLCFDDIYVEIY